MQYKVKCLNVIGKRNKIFYSGDIVTDDDFRPYVAERYVKSGHLFPIPSSCEFEDYKFEKKEIVIGITHYKRSNCLYELTKKIKQLNENAYIVVIDDFSEQEIDTSYIDHIIYNTENLGKKGFWMTVNKLWFFCRRHNPKYYISLVDDLIPNDNFFECIDIFERIEHGQKIAMDLGNYGREYNWTNFKRQDYNSETFLTQGTEQAFISKSEFIEYTIPRIGSGRWRKNELLGSGVGAAMNKYWVRQGKTIFGVKKSMFKHNKKCEQSMMNPIERKLNPWKII